MKNNRTSALLLLLVFLLVVAVVIIFLTGLDRTPVQNRPIQNVTVSGNPPILPETPAPSPTVVPTATPVPMPTTSYSYSTPAPAQTLRPIATAAPPAATQTPAATPTPVQPTEGVMLPAEELIPVVPGAAGNDSSGYNGTASGDNTSAAPAVPVGTSLGSGTFRSDTGTSLNIHADWSAVVGSTESVNFTVTVYVDSYSLYTTAAPEALNISVNGQYVSLASPAIEYDGTSGLLSTQINSRTFTINVPAGGSTSVPVAVVWHYRGTYGGVALDTIECGGSVSINR